MLYAYAALQALLLLFFLLRFLRRRKGLLPFVRLPESRFFWGLALALASAALLGAALHAKMWMTLAFLPAFELIGLWMMLLQFNFGVEPLDNAFLVTSLWGKTRQHAYGGISRIRFEANSATLFFPGGHITIDASAVNGAEFVQLARRKAEDFLNLDQQGEDQGR